MTEEKPPVCFKCKERPRAPATSLKDNRKWKPYCSQCATAIALKWKRRNKKRFQKLQQEYYARKKAKLNEA